MIILDNTNETLEVVTTTSQAIDVVVAYGDNTTTTFTLGGQETTITTATTTTICSAPGSVGTQRQIKAIFMENKGTSLNNITICRNTAGTTHIICSFNLGVNENFNYHNDGHWDVHSSDGSTKQYSTSASFENFVNSNKQKVKLLKTATRTTVAATSFSVFDLAGNPGSGTLAGTNTTNGVVPTDATAGHPLINTFTTSNGYIGGIQFVNTVASRLTLYDCLFKAGAYAFNANTTLTAQPSYASRIPSGSNYNDTEIWIEAVTAFTGNLSIAVTYTNQAGVTARTTGTIATGVAPTVGRMIQLPLQAGDTGVQKIESVVATVSTAGTFNILVLRTLAQGRINIANGMDKQGLSDSGMPQVFTDSALFLKVDSDSTSSGIPEVFMDIIG